MPLDDDLDLQRRAQQMLECSELVNVRVIAFAAERFGPAEAATAKVASETSYLVDEHTFANRYEWKAELADASEEVVAVLTATLLVEYEIHDGFVPDQEAGEAIAASTGFFAAYPYVREVFQSHCARLQLDPLVLGMLLRDSPSPRAITRSNSSAPVDRESES